MASIILVHVQSLSACCEVEQPGTAFHFYEVVITEESGVFLMIEHLEQRTLFKLLEIPLPQIPRILTVRTGDVKVTRFFVLVENLLGSTAMRGRGWKSHCKAIQTIASSHHMFDVCLDSATACVSALAFLPAYR